MQHADYQTGNTVKKRQYDETLLTSYQEKIVFLFSPSYSSLGNNIFHRKTEIILCLEKPNLMSLLSYILVGLDGEIVCVQYSTII